MLLRRLGFLLPLLLPVMVVTGYQRGGAWNFQVVVWVFGILPLLDLCAGADAGIPLPRGAVATVAWHRYFDAILYAWAALETALLVWGAAAFTRIADPLAAAGFLISVGVAAGGVGIVVAHELGHRRGLVPRALCWLLLALVGYVHFYIEHNEGHHARVATPADPATARFGESFWRFLPRTVAGSYASAWRIEAGRLAAHGRRTASLHNRMLWAAAAPLAIALALGTAFGPRAVLFYCGQAAVAVLLLEAVNYLEHYGLARRCRADGRYERVDRQHSWNSNRRLSNWFTFNLQRHSHHHVHVTRHYAELEHSPQAPQLPAGYPGMLLVALLPPLWRRLMDPRLTAWQRAAEGSSA